MTIEELSDNFALMDDWEDRYRYVIELGRTLPAMPETLKNDANKVRGCASQVWLATDVRRTGSRGEPVLHFIGDSDAHIVRGLIAILFSIYQDRPAEEIARRDALEEFSRLGLREHLTPQRSNGLASMVKRIRADAEDALAQSPSA